MERLVKRTLAFCFFILVSLTSCGDNLVYTWGDVALGLSQIYCAGINHCGVYANRTTCTKESRFFLCDLPGTCEVSVDMKTAETDLTACDNAVAALDPASDACYYLAFFSEMPPECNAAIDLAPPSDAGPS